MGPLSWSTTFCFSFCLKLVVVMAGWWFWNSINDHHLSDMIFFSFFKKYFWLTHTHTSPVLEPLVPCFGFLETSPLGFKARVGCLIWVVEANIMYIPWDPPLVLHIANLLTESIAGHQLGSYLAQGYYVHQWGSNPRSRDHEFYALTTRPRVPVLWLLMRVIPP